ncbi:actin cortical patch SUR7/pH-response regulator pali [Biscogniauxia sp. FL1348]|nr:actin cortical patch SUR7/pH-response regulator pali [Biscogniauxia sp. FL1348]
MARTGFFHHIGTFLLFAAVVLLIIADISAPVVANISLLRVELDSSSSSGQQPVITFGTFGWCAQHVTSSSSSSSSSTRHCTRASVGYDPISAVEQYTDGSLSSVGDAATASARALTRVMVLHAVATGLAFVSFALAAGAGVVGSLLGALGALVSFVVVLVALVCDFVGLAIVRSAINDASDDIGGDGVTANARWGSAAWTVLAAAVCCLLAAVVLFFTCCSARMHRRREARGGVAKY